MGVVKYKVTGTYKPFLIILRNGENIIQSRVVENSGETLEFQNIPRGNYILESYDRRSGFIETQVSVI